MKRHHLLATQLMAVAFGGLLLASCAQDGFDDETFASDVTNTQLVSPSSDDITITPNADGSRQTVAWPLIKGAKGFEVKISNVNDPAEPKLVVDSIVDGYSITLSREEDTNYELSIRTLANTALGNTDATETTQKSFTTFAASFATIPDNTDLYQYFQENPVPDPAEDAESDEFIYDLVAAGNYTISEPLDFNYHKVTLRTASKTSFANITLANGANFIASNDLTLNYLNIDASATQKAFIELQNYATAPDGILEKPGNYYLINSVRLMNSNIKGVVGSLIYDNNKAWCVVNFLMKNVLIELNTTTSTVKNQALVSFQGGGVKDFSISNTTVYQTGEGNVNYFIRYNNSARIDRFGWTTADHTTMTYKNNTFYKVASSQWGNYSGISNYTTYDVQSNIWYDCADGAIARRLMGNGRLGNNATANWVNNTYWNSTNGQVDQGTYDNSGTALTTDPAFTDAAGGNFTPTGAEQVENKTGDLRWFE